NAVTSSGGLRGEMQWHWSLSIDRAPSIDNVLLLVRLDSPERKDIRRRIFLFRSQRQAEQWERARRTRRDRTSPWLAQQQLIAGHCRFRGDCRCLLPEIVVSRR